MQGVPAGGLGADANDGTNPIREGYAVDRGRRGSADHAACEVAGDADRDPRLRGQTTEPRVIEVPDFRHPTEVRGLLCAPAWARSNTREHASHVCEVSFAGRRFYFLLSAPFLPSDSQRPPVRWRVLLGSLRRQDLGGAIVTLLHHSAPNKKQTATRG